jgi:hypothetical protein
MTVDGHAERWRSVHIRAGDMKMRRVEHAIVVMRRVEHAIVARMEW